MLKWKGKEKFSVTLMNYKLLSFFKYYFSILGQAARTWSFNIAAHSLSRVSDDKNISQAVSFCCLPAGNRSVPGSLETSNHRDGLFSWLPWRRSWWHQGWHDWNPLAPVGGEDRWAHPHQETSASLWESQEGHVGELHIAQVAMLASFHLLSL